MAKPVWSKTSNTSLGTFVERQRLGVGSVPVISLPVSDPDKIDNLETVQFLNNVDIYGTLNYVYIKSNGLAKTKWSGAPVGYDKFSPTAQSYVFKIPTIRLDVPLTQPDFKISTTNYIGVAIDGVPFRSPNIGKTTILGGKKYTENSVSYPVRGFFLDGSGVIDSSQSFYYQSCPNKLLATDPTTGHSKIIGFAFDGLPIYGPFGFVNPLHNQGGIKVMTPSYRVKKQLRANNTVPDGTYIEDFEYVKNLGDLDEYNSRFCITPEYPNGIQAYFVTIDPARPLYPLYPYILGPQYWGSPITTNGNFAWPGDINVSVISGKLPAGLFLQDKEIIGTPFAVLTETTNRFVLRASNLDGVSDRTFTITIANQGQSIEWATPAGALPVGPNKSYYILDNALINFQLDAIDNDLPSSKLLNYHIPPNGGELPGGIKLSSTGLLYGFTAPLLAVDTGGYNGKYDANFYDKFGYDYGVRPMNGYDSFFFDNETFDFSKPNRAPKKLNRYYQFVVRASDGVRFLNRTFRIYVVGDDYLRADNDLMLVGNNTFSADNTYMRKVIWITPNYLGRLRANNYITIIMDVFDPATLEGTLGFIPARVNDEAIINKASWPASVTGSPTNICVITVNPSNLIGDLKTDLIDKKYPYYYLESDIFPLDAHVTKWDAANSRLTVEWKDKIDIPYGINKTIRIGTKSELPPGMEVDQLTGNVYGSVPYQPAVTKTYKFTINALRYSVDPSVPNVSSYRTFTVDIIGNIDSVIKFVTDGDLGSINANFISNLSIKATTTVDTVLTYRLVSGKLPPGLKLVDDGSIQGKVNQFNDTQNSGLITFDENNTTFDNYDTTFDRSYTFTVEARDQFNKFAETKTFRLNIDTPNKKLYSNIYVKPMLAPSMRIAVNQLFNNSDIFTPSSIYRPSDLSFGVQNELKMLLYAGIETKSINDYVSAFGRTSKKQFRLGEIKKAIAKDPGTNHVVYELVYIEIIDNQENSNGSVAEYIDTHRLSHSISVNQGRRDIIDSDPTNNNIMDMTLDSLSRILIQDKVITADSTGQQAGDSNKSSVFGNSVTNMRNNVSSIGDTERNYLPLWMRTAQSYSGIEQGFTKAVPICYCVPGAADDIILNIKNSGFDFKTINYTVDRAIIDSVVGDTGDKYIAFAAREVING